jgi:hypothetical protein
MCCGKAELISRFDIIKGYVVCKVDEIVENRISA